MLRRGPNLVDSFSSLIRDSQYCASELPHQSSLEDGLDQSKRWEDIIVRLGDVKPDEDVGHVAVGVVNDERQVSRLRLKREYD
jgi:hypothetical protein